MDFRKTKRSEDETPVEKEAVYPEWMNDATRIGKAPSGFKLRNLEFGAKGAQGSPLLESIGLKDLIAATAFESADLKANHSEPGALTGMLQETMSKLEDKYHSGVYDAAAMPLVEQYLSEMRVMANIQLERNEVIAKRVLDVKEANEAAYNAVYEARSKREEEIRENAKFIKDERDINNYKKRQEKQEIRRTKKENKRLLKNMKEINKITARQNREESRKEDKEASEQIRERGDELRTARKQASYKARIAKDELRCMEAQAEAKKLELQTAHVAAKMAELNLSKARTEMAHRSLQEQQATAMEEVSEASEKLNNIYDDRISTVKADVETRKEDVENQLEELGLSNQDTPQSEEIDKPEIEVSELKNESSDPSQKQPLTADEILLEDVDDSEAEEDTSLITRMRTRISRAVAPKK